MRRLLLLRHAKAVRLAAGGDHERGLTDGGRKGATALGRWLDAQAVLPDAVLVSTALRTRETAALVLAELPVRPDVRHERRLYLAEAPVILGLLRETGPAVRTLMAVGHNPDFAELAVVLAGHGNAAAYARMRAKFPTCALAILDFDSKDWRGLAPGAGSLAAFVTPGTLGSAVIERQPPGEE
jgi:phosphohistidine phosphatase